MRKKKDKFIHISKPMQQTLSRYRPDSMEDFSQIWESWKEVVGGPLSGQTRLTGLKSGMLQVRVSHSTFRHQLEYMKPDIIKQINQALGRTMVSDIRFSVGALS